MDGFGMTKLLYNIIKVDFMNLYDIFSGKGLTSSLYA